MAYLREQMADRTEVGDGGLSPGFAVRATPA